MDQVIGAAKRQEFQNYKRVMKTYRVNHPEKEDDWGYDDEYYKLSQKLMNDVPNADLVDLRNNRWLQAIMATENGEWVELTPDRVREIFSEAIGEYRSGLYNDRVGDAIMGVGEAMRDIAYGNLSLSEADEENYDPAEWTLTYYADW